MSSFPNSNTSSLSKHRIFMLFSHSSSPVLLEPTRSEMNVGQLAGHSCLRTVIRVRLSLPMKGRVVADWGTEDS